MEIQMEKLLQLIGEQTVELAVYRARVAELEKELEALKSCPDDLSLMSA